MFNVEKIANGFYVTNWNGNAVIGYRNKKHAEQYAVGATYELFGAAEMYNERRDYVLAYLAARKTRIAKPVAQLELF